MEYMQQCGICGLSQDPSNNFCPRCGSDKLTIKPARRASSGLRSSEWLAEAGSALRHARNAYDWGRKRHTYEDERDLAYMCIFLTPPPFGYRQAHRLAPMKASKSPTGIEGASSVREMEKCPDDSTQDIWNAALES